MIAVLQQRINHRSQGRQADAAGDNHYVFPFHGVERPAAAEGATQPDQGVGPQFLDRVGYRADQADGVFQRVGAAGIGTDGNRRLAHPRHIEHVELSGREAIHLANLLVHELYGEGAGVEVFLPHRQHPLGAGIQVFMPQIGSGASQLRTGP